VCAANQWSVLRQARLAREVGLAKGGIQRIYEIDLIVPGDVCPHDLRAPTKGSPRAGADVLRNARPKAASVYDLERVGSPDKNAAARTATQVLSSSLCLTKMQRNRSP
jgi:hypothetical protein